MCGQQTVEVAGAKKRNSGRLSFQRALNVTKKKFRFYFIV
jgi:hypothetical protein